LGNDYNHCCIECNAEYSFEITINNYINCYKKCDNYYYFDENNNYQCTDKLSCPIEYPVLNQEKKECLARDTKSIDTLIEEILLFKNNETQEGKEEEINKYNKLLEAIESFFTSNNYDLKRIDRGEDQFIEANKLLITLTSIEN